MEVLTRAIAFMVGLPRWLQVFAIVVLIQAFTLVVLGLVFGLRASTADKKPVRIEGVPDASRSNSTSRESTVPETTPRPERASGLVSGGRGVGEHSSEVGMNMGVSAVRTTVDGFPIVDVTLVNNNSGVRVVNACVISVVQYQPTASVPEARVLKPDAVLDVVLPYGDGRTALRLSPAVAIEGGGVGVVRFRFSDRVSGATVSPPDAGMYTIVVSLRFIGGGEVSTEPIEL